MKALTLWQPWATLMAIGAKTIETRPATAFWAKNFRGALAIHAAKTWNQEVLECLTHSVEYPVSHETREWRLMVDALVDAGYIRLADVPTGSVLCVVNVVSVGAICQGTHGEGPQVVFPDGASIDVAEEGEEEFGDYRAGRLGIVTSYVRRLKEPIPCRGKQGIWEWTDAEQYALENHELWCVK